MSTFNRTSRNCGKLLTLISLFLVLVPAFAIASGNALEYLSELGVSYYNKGNYDASLHEFNKVLLIEPQNEVAKKYIAKIFNVYSQTHELPYKKLSRGKIISKTLDSLETKIQQCIIDEKAAKQLKDKNYRVAFSPECIAYIHGVKAIPQEDYKTAKFAVNSQVSSFTGDFGDLDKKTTAIIQFSETFKYIGKNGEISLSLPYVIRNGGGVTPGETTIVSFKAVPKRADGIGDIWLKGEYYWIDETDKIPSIDLNGRIKFPLANHDRGLGTGRADFGSGISFMKRFDNIIALLDLGILVRQRPNASTLKPFRFDYSPGVGYMFTKKFSSYLFLDGSTKPAKNDKKPLELVLASTYKLQQKLTLNAYLLFGLSKSSPDIGASTGITRYF